MYRNSNSISYFIVIVIFIIIGVGIVIVLVMLSVIVRLLIHFILILLFDYYIDITTCSIVNGKSICIIHNRNHNHVNIDGKLLL